MISESVKAILRYTKYINTIYKYCIYMNKYELVYIFYIFTKTLKNSNRIVLHSIL